MPQNNKSTAKSPFTPKPVVYAAWGLLAAALVAHFVPALEAVALVLYAVGLIALCFLALTAPKKGTIAVPRVFLPMLAAAFLIVGCQIGMRPDESPLVWRSILLALILLIPLVYLLPLFIPDTVFAIFLAEPIADVLAVLCTVTLFMHVFRKTMRGIAA